MLPTINRCGDLRIGQQDGRILTDDQRCNQERADPRDGVRSQMLSPFCRLQVSHRSWMLRSVFAPPLITGMM